MIGDFSAAAERLPHKQTKPPNRPYTPAEAIARMKVPEGFSVELVAAEPDLVNPVAMTFDERGRVWVTESLEYPRKSAGPGKDRIKILEDTDGDGTADKVKIFADGLNIPSGIALGYGGVWVANAPDILFYPDRNRDDVPDGPPKVIVTGFGRADTHELPNSLTWGPDGYLYGLNGVFNPSTIEHGGNKFEFTCAMFRIHPRTHAFSLFCEGTSNPWGIAFNDVGDAFVSACVIDHLWHLVETGYYHRQGGPYPPFTWKLGSIVDYKHQMAAYCGLHWFDSDAYPEQYRKKLFMGNLHGGCINVDRLEKNGATYKGKPEGDFLTADDVWFMPVSQKTGPDGCLYILDWYDRYHCYQDARADPEGIDRLKGRLYRVRYQNTPRAEPVDLAKETDDELLQRLKSPNIYYRDIAQRLLAEREVHATREKLEAIVLNDKAAYHTRMHALWARISSGAITKKFYDALALHADPVLRAWAERAVGNADIAGNSYATQVYPEPPLDASPAVRLQKIIQVNKRFGEHNPKYLLEIAAANGGDPLLDRIAWQNLLPHFEHDAAAVMAEFLKLPPDKRTGELIELTKQVLNRWLADDRVTAEQVVSALNQMVEDRKPFIMLGLTLEALTKRIQSGEFPAKKYQVVAKSLGPIFATPGDASGCDLALDASINLGATLGLEPGVTHARRTVVQPHADEGARLVRFEALVFARDEQVLELARKILQDDKSPPQLQVGIINALGRSRLDGVAPLILDAYAGLATAQQPIAVELLTTRAAWSNTLLDAIAAGKLSKDAVNLTQIAKLLKSSDKKLAARAEQTWGKLRTERNPQREQVVADMKKLLTGSAGDPLKGQIVYMKLCGQCHKLHGTGQEVGPDITVNGRASFAQLLNNVFDPSLVIGNAYQARTVVTSDGRVLTGLLVEDNPQRVVLKLQGGKLETIARGDVEEMEVSKLSMMPEGVEKQLTPQELIDLFALLKLDKAPTDANSQTLPNFTELK